MDVVYAFMKLRVKLHAHSPTVQRVEINGTQGTLLELKQLLGLLHADLSLNKRVGKPHAPMHAELRILHLQDILGPHDASLSSLGICGGATIYVLQKPAALGMGSQTEPNKTKTDLSIDSREPPTAAPSDETVAEPASGVSSLVEALAPPSALPVHLKRVLDAAAAGVAGSEKASPSPHVLLLAVLRAAMVEAGFRIVAGKVRISISDTCLKNIEPFPV